MKLLIIGTPLFEECVCVRACAHVFLHNLSTRLNIVLFTSLIPLYTCLIVHQLVAKLKKCMLEMVFNKSDDSLVSVG